ncbi:SdpI family protein [Kaistella faecalis]|uniref:SdpI family protein n=1 Tax=Kaistella faecalis TaxID=2852098 RepID=UPI001C47FC28|nr:SdpI family protein [Chryseobacterium faecale]UFK97276.1 SdpI family protein [Chryseobacterium faecale]
MINQLFEDPFFNITALVGGILFVAGFIMYRFPPKKINYFYGYRTNSSMKNQDRWDFAQKYSARQMMVTGFFLAASSLLVLFSDFGSFLTLGVGLAFVILAGVILLIRVEKAIKRRFEEQ